MPFSRVATPPVRAAVLAAALLAGAAFVVAGVEAQPLESPFYDWDLERYRILRPPEAPTGAMLPLPEIPEDTDLPLSRASEILMEGADVRRPVPVEESSGLRARDGVRLRAAIDGHVPFPHGLRLDLGGRFRIGEGNRSGGDWLERSLVWSRGRTEVRAGLTRLFWGDGNEGSLLLGRTAPAFDRLSIRTIRPWTFGGSRSAARFHASLFLGYLDERDRVVPYPLLHGQRLEWEPAGWAKLSLARTILFGGSGRTEKLTLRDIGDILLGRNENRVGPRSAADSDQKASIGLELRTPREWLEGKWFEGARLFWEYGGEDSFQGPLPTAVAHHYGLSALVAGWTVLAETAETWDDANDWYENHLVYGERDYYYRGYVMGHPMGGDAVSVHASLWSPPWNQNRAQLWWRLRTIHSPEPGAHRERSATLGGALRRNLDERTIAEARFETSYAPDGEGDGHPDPPVAWRATIGLRRGFPSPWAR